MSPIESLKFGIETGSWAKVCQAYTELTGQTIPTPAENSADSPRLADVKRAIDRVFEKLGLLAEQASSTIVVPTQDEMRVLRDGPSNGDIDPDAEDTVTKADIDGEGPVEDLKTIGAGGRKTVFGARMQFVSGAEVSSAEITRNREKAKTAAARKVTRPAPPTFTTTCTDCHREFESLRKLDPGVGQKCPRCIGKMKKD
jgi:hypothetical protein